MRHFPFQISFWIFMIYSWDKWSESLFPIFRKKWCSFLSRKMAFRDLKIFGTSSSSSSEADVFWSLRFVIGRPWTFVAALIELVEKITRGHRFSAAASPCLAVFYLSFFIFCFIICDVTQPPMIWTLALKPFGVTPFLKIYSWSKLTQKSKSLTSN